MEIKGQEESLKAQPQEARPERGAEPTVYPGTRHLARRRVSTSLEQGIWTGEWERTLDTLQEKLESSQGHFYRAHMVSAVSEEGAVEG